MNSSPGLEGIEKASGVNVAGAIVDYVMEDTAFAEVDIGQLLRTVPGRACSPCNSATTRKWSASGWTRCSLPSRSLRYGDRLVWNPDHDVQLRYDDVLVCYGELTELRASLRQAMLGVPREALMFDDAAETSEQTEG